MDVLPDSGGGVADHLRQGAAFLEKAIREAKLHTSWDSPNPIYEGAVNHFASAVLRSRRFMAEVGEMAARVRRPGWSNSLALKLLTLRRPASPTSTRAASCGTFRWSTPTTAGPSTTESGQAC